MEQNVFLTKIIGIIVAVIVAAVVLVPICDSLTEGNGNEGDSGGGGGDGEFDGVVLNNLQTMYAEMGLTVPFKTFQSYYGSPYETGGMPISKDISSLELTLDMDYIEQVSAVENTEGYETSQNIILLNLVIRLESEEYYEFDFNIYLSHGQDSNPNSLMFNIAEYIDDDNGYDNQYGFVSDITAFTLTVHEGVLSLSLDAIADGSPVQIRKSADVREEAIDLVYISDDEIGWVGGWMYAYNGEGIIPFPDLMEGSVFQTSEISIEYQLDGDEYYAFAIPLIEVKDIQNDTLVGTVKVYSASGDWGYDYNKYFIVEYEIPLTEVSEGVYRFVDGRDSATWTIVGSVGLDGAEPSSSSFSWIYLWSEFTNYASSVNANPATIGEGGSGGSSSSSSDLGVAGTIIGIIPIFVILAILMGAVGLFYQNRKTI